jgi:hypothetical protein
LTPAWLRQLLNRFAKGFGLTPVSLKILGGDSSHLELYFSLQTINPNILDSEALERLLHIFRAAQGSLQYVRSGIIAFSRHPAEEFFDRESHRFAGKLLIDGTPFHAEIGATNNDWSIQGENALIHLMQDGHCDWRFVSAQHWKSFVTLAEPPITSFYDLDTTPTVPRDSAMLRI